MTAIENSKAVKAGPDTIFVLGNGPSLRNVDLRSLSPFATIGLNAAYRYWREIDWRPRYYACLDTVVGISHKEEIRALIEEGRIEKFLLRENLIDMLGEAGRNARVVNFDAARTDEALLRPAAVTTGSHSALWGASLGYKKIVILGVDARYKEFVEGSKRGDGIELEIVEAGDNPNYFFEGYQQPGDKYNIPNPRPDLHVGAWRDAMRLLKEAHVDVYNGNPQSAVRVFPFIDVHQFLGEGAIPAPADEDAGAASLNGSTSSSLAAAESGSSRPRKFLKSYGPLLAGVLAVLAAFIAFFGGAGRDIIPLLFAAGLFYPLLALVLYIRMAVVDHLAALQAESDRLHALYKDLARRIR